MGYAKSLGKQYNAESAWNSLGTDRSSYEAGSQPRYKQIFDYIAVEPRLPRQSSISDEGIFQDVYGSGGRIDMRDAEALAELSQNLLSSVYGNVNNLVAMPQTLSQNLIAGKFMNVF